MSSYMKQGKRRAAHAKQITVRKHTQKFFKLLGKLDYVAQEIIKSGKPAKVENIQELAFPYFERKLDDMEQNILLNKIYQVYEKLGIEVKEKVKEDE